MSKRRIPCNACGVPKPISQYQADPRYTTGHRSRCRACDAAYYKRWRASKAAAGLCFRCGQRPCAAGIARCVECSAADRLYKLEQRRERQLAGLCLMCGDPAPDSSDCAACRDYKSAWKRERRAAQRAA